jgi:hypothetical protein
MDCNIILISFNDGQISLTSILKFDGNMVGPLRIFIHLIDIKRLESKTSNIITSIEIEFFLKIRPNKK